MELVPRAWLARCLACACVRLFGHRLSRPPTLCAAVGVSERDADKSVETYLKDTCETLVRRVMDEADANAMALRSQFSVYKRELTSALADKHAADAADTEAKTGAYARRMLPPAQLGSTLTVRLPRSLQSHLVPLTSHPMCLFTHLILTHLVPPRHTMPHHVMPLGVR